NLVLLDDPRGAIPPYDALLLLSPRVADREEVVSALAPLIGAISDDRMRSANGLVDREAGERSPSAAAEALRGRIEGRDEGDSSPIPDADGERRPRGAG